MTELYIVVLVCPGFLTRVLAIEIDQKAKMVAGPRRRPTKAPLGFKNIRESIGGRQDSYIVPNPHMALLVVTVF